MKRNIIFSKLFCKLPSLMLRTAFLENSKEKVTLSKDKFRKLILIMLCTFCDILNLREK